VPRVPHRPRAGAPAATLVGALAATVLLSGCGKPPELIPRPQVPVPTTTAAPASPASTLPPGFTPPPTRPTPAATPSFDENFAVACRDHPDASVVIALVRRSGSLPTGGSGVTASSGPLCAGTWQYTVLTVPGKEPLQVVTEGRPDALRLVTAGTDVCTVDVRAVAPIGIRQAANC
jgi:hypothetical protein